MVAVVFGVVVACVVVVLVVVVVVVIVDDVDFVPHDANTKDSVIKPLKITIANFPFIFSPLFYFYSDFTLRLNQLTLTYTKCLFSLSQMPKQSVTFICPFPRFNDIMF